MKEAREEDQELDEDYLFNDEELDALRLEEEQTPRFINLPAGEFTMPLGSSPAEPVFIALGRPAVEQRTDANEGEQELGQEYLFNEAELETLRLKEEAAPRLAKLSAKKILRPQRASPSEPMPTTPTSRSMISSQATPQRPTPARGEERERARPYSRPASKRPSISTSSASSEPMKKALSSSGNRRAAQKARH